MNRLTMLLVCMAILPSLTLADTVFTATGNYEGKVTRKDGKVIVEQADGKTVTLDAKDVSYIHIAANGGKIDAPAATSKPTTAPEPMAGIVTEEITRPESMAFIAMRKLAIIDAGALSFDLRQNVVTWREAAHDRKRKVMGNWVLPKDFIQHRKAFDEQVKDAKDLITKAKAALALKTPPTDARDKLAAAYAKMRSAATGWEDPLLRDFLTGVTDYHSGNYTQGWTLFHQCRQANPKVAAFAQGEALCLMEMDRGIDALAAAIATLELKPDSQDALTLVRKAMQKVPGSEIKNTIYIRAQEFANQYPADSKTPTPGVVVVKTVNWLMPGKPWISRDDAIPTPPIDRLVFRQAAGVPVDKNTLLVDASAIDDAQDIVVRVGRNQYASATVRKITATGKGIMPPLALLTVTDYTFTPITIDENLDLSGKSSGIYGVGMYEELGPGWREIQARVEMTSEKAVRLAKGLQPGEATAPVIAEDGSLMGFLTGRTDVTADGGGTNQVIPLTQISALIKAAAKPGSSSGRLKRTFTPAEAAGKAFMVYGIGGERFEDK